MFKKLIKRILYNVLIEYVIPFLEEWLTNLVESEINMKFENGTDKNAIQRLSNAQRNALKTQLKIKLKEQLLNT